VADVVPSSTASAFDAKMSEKCKCTFPRAIQMKNQQKIVSIEDKLDIIYQPEKK
jgi:hypothetical protein